MICQIVLPWTFFASIYMFGAVIILTIVRIISRKYYGKHRSDQNNALIEFWIPYDNSFEMKAFFFFVWPLGFFALIFVGIWTLIFEKIFKFISLLSDKLYKISERFI